MPRRRCQSTVQVGFSRIFEELGTSPLIYVTAINGSHANLIQHLLQVSQQTLTKGKVSDPPQGVL